MLNADRCWEAVERRDRGLDGSFFFGVTTTGVYCRPSCPARRPLRRNVRFYATPGDAERDGLRPCLRCRPLEAFSTLTDARIVELCAYKEDHCQERLTLAALAARAGLNRFHLQRSFKAAAGLSPREYIAACRLRRLKQGLKEPEGVAAAIYDAGFGSSSRVYERAGAQLGMTPAQYRRGGRGLAIAWAELDSPAGLMLAGATERGICYLQFGDSVEELLAGLRKEYPHAAVTPAGADPPARFQSWMRAIDALFSGAHAGADLPLDVRATAFQAAVWERVRSIPRGEVRSYADVAAAIGRPKAARAVARACASNVVAVGIPCHRVVRGTGEAGGYRWGIERKRKLLAMEGAGGN